MQNPPLHPPVLASVLPFRAPSAGVGPPGRLEFYFLSNVEESRIGCNLPVIYLAIKLRLTGIPHSFRNGFFCCFSDNLPATERHRVINCPAKHTAMQLFPVTFAVMLAGVTRDITTATFGLNRSTRVFFSKCVYLGCIWDVVVRKM